jgi:hypothetical protein
MMTRSEQIALTVGFAGWVALIVVVGNWIYQIAMWVW